MAYLLHSDFFCSTPWGVIYVLYIINTFFGKIPIKIIPRIIAVANAFYVVYVLYIITNVFGKISLKIIPRIIAASNFFLWYMSLYYQYCYCTFFYKNYTANHRSHNSFYRTFVLYSHRTFVLFETVLLSFTIYKLLIKSYLL